MAEPLKGWAGGINNRAGDLSVPKGFLRDCINADAREDGSVVRRDGFTKLVSAGCSGLFSMGDYGYYVADKQLFKLENNVSTLIASGIGPYPAYAMIGSELVFGDGINLYKLADTLTQLGGFATGAIPQVTIGQGGLDAGVYTYGVYVSTVDGDTGVMATEQVTLQQGGALTFALPPGTTLACSTCNGVELHRVSGNTVRSEMDLQETLSTTNETRLPAGRFLAWWYGRLITADNNFLYYSEPLSKCMYKPNKGYAYIGNIRMMAPVEKGIYIATDTKTYLLEGAVPEEWELVEVFNFGAPFGHPAYSDEGKSGYWMSDKGLVAFNKEGAIKVLDALGAYAPEASASAALLYRASDGEDSVVATLFDSETAKQASRNWIEASVTHEGNLK